MLSLSTQNNQKRQSIVLFLNKIVVQNLVIYTPQLINVSSGMKRSMNIHVKLSKSVFGHQAGAIPLTQTAIHQWYLEN